jgi:aspartate aminotransferase-like enzyme
MRELASANTRFVTRRIASSGAAQRAYLRLPFDFDAKSVSFACDARRFTQSTMSYVSIAGLTASIEQLLSLGEDHIEAHARQLAAMLVDGAHECGWKPFHDVHSVAASPHIISLGHSQKGAREVVERLRDHRIICSARGERIRVSLAPYNDADDVNELVRGRSLTFTDHDHQPSLTYTVFQKPLQISCAVFAFQSVPQEANSLKCFY